MQIEHDSSNETERNVCIDLIFLQDAIKRKGMRCRKHKENQKLYGREKERKRKRKIQNIKALN
jgi:hypothetical protein